MDHDGLRKKLIAAKLAGSKTDEGWAYVFRSNEEAADTALRVLIRWLNEQAAEAEEQIGPIVAAGPWNDWCTRLRNLADVSRMLAIRLEPDSGVDLNGEQTTEAPDG